MKNSNEKVNVSRRRFLEFGLVGAAAIASHSFYYNRRRDDPLEFLNIPAAKIIHPSNRIDDMLRGSVQCGERRIVNLENMPEADSRMLKEALLRRLARIPPYPYVMKTESTLFIMPANDYKVAVKVKDYCMAAEQFLHTAIKGFSAPMFSWTIVKPGESYSSGFDRRAFIGAHHYELTESSLRKEGESDIFVKEGVMNTRPGAAAMHYIDKNSESKFILVSVNETTLVAPFSEIIPFSADYKKSEEFEREWGAEERYSAVEAFSESLSYHLAKEFVQKKYGLSEELAEALARKRYGRELYGGRPQYNNVRAAIEWTRENGIQANYDLFMKDIVSFVRAINEYKYKNELFVPL